MDNYYVVGELNPLTEMDCQAIEKTISAKMPVDYRAFLTNYGFGDFNEVLTIKEPDHEHFKTLFQDDLDLWELTDVEKPILLKGVTIAHTMDGDTILLTSDDERPFVVMPRHADKPVYFSSLSALIQHYKTLYEINDDAFYFDVHHNARMELLDGFHKNGLLQSDIIDQVHAQFKTTFNIDKLIDHPQPTYIIQKIGGWVFFDLIYKSSIRIKYQVQSENEAQRIINFINDRICDAL